MAAFFGSAHRKVGGRTGSVAGIAGPGATVCRPSHPVGGGGDPFKNGEHVPMFQLDEALPRHHNKGESNLVLWEVQRLVHFPQRIIVLHPVFLTIFSYPILNF